MKMKHTVLAALAALMLAGCVTKEERLARAAAERTRQEQIAREAKEREERLAMEQAERVRRDKLAEIECLDDIDKLRQKIIDESDFSVKEGAKRRLIKVINVSSDAVKLQSLARYTSDDEICDAVDGRMVALTFSAINNSSDEKWLQCIYTKSDYEASKVESQDEAQALAKYMSEHVHPEIKKPAIARLIAITDDVVWLESVAAKDDNEEIKTIATDKIREIKGRAAAAIDKYYDDLAEHNYKLILGVFEKFSWGEPLARIVSMPGGIAWWDYNWPEFVGKPWQRMVDVRQKITEEEANEGSAKLEEFGTRYLPNAYADYEKVRDNAIEIQQMFNEEMPEPYNIKKDDPKYTAYTKLVHGLMKARTQSFRRHDELCHYYLLHKVGALSADDLAKIDSEKISIRLYEENLNYIDFTRAGVNARSLVTLGGKTRAFAEKFAPETYASYQKCETIRSDSQHLLDELLTDVSMMDITRFELPIVACREKIDFLTQTINSLSFDMEAWYAEYKIMEKDAEAIASLDHETALKWKGFMDLLPAYIKDRSNGPMIALDSPMHKYYPSNVLCQWHLQAAGIIPFGRGWSKPLTYDVCKIGDFPFSESAKSIVSSSVDRLDCSIDLLISLRKYTRGENMDYLHYLLGFACQSERVGFAEYYERYWKYGIGPFVRCLNEIDAGKAQYHDIDIPDINFEANGVSLESLKGHVLIVR